MKRLLTGLIVGAIILMVWSAARRGRLGAKAQNATDNVNQALNRLIQPSGAAQRNQMPSVSVADQPYVGPVGPSQSNPTYPDGAADTGNDFGSAALKQYGIGVEPDTFLSNFGPIFGAQALSQYGIGGPQLQQFGLDIGVSRN